MSRNDGRKRKTDFAKIWFIGSCAVTLFAYGVAVGRYQIFPFDTLYYLTDSLYQLRREAPVIAGLRPAWHLKPARYEGDGVTLAQTDRMAPGLTLVTGLLDGIGQLRLIEADGTVVRSWPARFTELFRDAAHLEPRDMPRTDWNAQVHGAVALPDGSVVFNFDYAGTVKMDRCGEVQWILPRRTHHSVERSQKGGFWVPGRSYSHVVDGFPRSEAGYEEDLILRVSDEGEVVDEMSVARLFLDNDLLPLLLLEGTDTVFMPDEIVHLNDIEELPDSLADRFPGFEAGDLVLSFRDRHMIMVVDPDDWTVRWYRMGPWIRPHDPDFLADGTILVFSNHDDDTSDGAHLGGSRVVAVDPTTGETSRIHGGVPGETFYTDILGKHQRLPNGNLLITESQAGRLFEVSPDGEVVWELVNRWDEESIAVLSQATRYPPGYFEVQDWSCAP